MKIITIRATLAVLCIMFVVGGAIEARENTDRKPEQEIANFDASEDSSTLLFRVVDEDEVAITTTSAIYKVVVESEETPQETESPWVKKFWKEKMEQIKIFFSNGK